MPNPIKTDALAAKGGIEGNLGGRVRLRSAIRVTERQGQKIFGQVNQNVVRNPNRARSNGTRTHATNAKFQNQNVQTLNQGNGTRTRRNNGGIQNPRADRSNRETEIRLNENTDNGRHNASTKGLANGLGHHKDVRTNQTGNQNNTNNNQINTNNQGNGNNQNNEINIDNQTVRTTDYGHTTQTANHHGRNNNQGNTHRQNDFEIITNNQGNIIRQNENDEENGRRTRRRGNEHNSNNYGNGHNPRRNGHIQNPRNQNVPHPQQNNQGNSPQQTQTGGQQTSPVLTVNHHQNETINYLLNQNTTAQNVHHTNFLRHVVKDVLRQNNIHLNGNAINTLVRDCLGGNRHQNQFPISPEVRNLVQNIRNEILFPSNNSMPLSGRDIKQIVSEVLVRFQNEIDTARPIFFHDKCLEAKIFKHLNMSERLNAAIDLMSQYFPEEFVEIFSRFQPREIQCGLLLPCGFIVGHENSAELRALVSFQPPVLPREISIAQLRDVGQFVKILIAETGIAKSMQNLDLAVQKFVRLLLANNELGVLLATISLASQTIDRGGLTSRTIELVKIYELIARFIANGEKFLQNASAQNATKNPFAKPERGEASFVSVGKSLDADEKSQLSAKQYGTGAESSLRQFLEFNPSAFFDKSASAFTNSDDARQAQKDFVNLYQNEIEDWLKSGNHRFVRDFDFDKPLGVVVERNSEGVFTANKMRVILVRDSSVQGWHFLKSVLVK